MSIDVVTLDAASTGQAMLLSAEAGWNQVAADWGVFMARGTVFGAIADDRVVATAAALPYGSEFGWVSMVLVTASWRGRGIATQLVAACVSLLRDAGRSAFLDATPAGAAVYAKLGFRPVCAMERWQGEGRALAVPNAAAEFTADTAAFGADRRFLLEEFMVRPRSLSVAAASGFAVLRQGTHAMQIGPLVAAPLDAVPLANAAADAASGPVLIDVLDAGRALLPALAARGFRRQRPFTRMALGRAAAPGDPARLLAAAGPEFG